MAEMALPVESVYLLEGPKPIHSAPCRSCPLVHEKVDYEIQQMLDASVISDCDSEVSFSIVWCRKPTEVFILCGLLQDQ